MPNGEQNGTTSSDTLYGWKDIATYLNRSVRAVQRWEHELGLPVHRIKATDGHTVYALRAEIDAWRKSRDLPKTEPEDHEEEADAAAPVVLAQNSAIPTSDLTESTASPTLRRRWLMMALAAVLLFTIGAASGAFLVAKLANRAGPMASIQAAGTDVVAYDSFGRVAWTSSFRRQISHADGFTSRTGPDSTFVDLDRDGQSEALVPLRFSSAGRPASETDALVAFDAHGRILWTVQPDQHFQCGDDRFEGPWRIYAVRASTGPGPQRVWVAFNHSTWWPGFVMEVTSEGQAHVRMLHTGWIQDLAEWRTPSGVLLAVSGYNNEHVRPTLSLLDLDSKPSMSPHAEPRFLCDAAPQDTPKRIYLLPPLDSGIPANASVDLITVLASALKVRVSNYDGSAAAEIGDDLEVKYFSMTDSYWAVHRRREVEGFLTHSANECPLRDQPQPIDEWTPDTGWRSSTIMPTVRQSPARK